MLFVRHKYLLTASIFVLVFAFVWIWLVYFDNYENKSQIYGVSFDPEYAGSLRIDPKDVFKKIVSDWKFKYVRLSLHWDRVEKKAPGQFDFSEMDYYVKEAEKNGVKVMIAIGNKTPRWPECHTPDWAKTLQGEYYHKELRGYMAAVVEHYKNSPALEKWQVENEPFLFFGGCYRITPEQLKQEISLVKSIDPVHPVVVADSGELSTWQNTARAGDEFGTTLYRMVWNKYLGFFDYGWIPASFYRVRFAMFHRTASDTMVAELQAEPWVPSGSLADMPMADQNKTMNLERLKKNIVFARKTGVGRVYLWGAEWWAWLNSREDNEITDYVTSLTSGSNMAGR